MNYIHIKFLGGLRLMFNRKNVLSVLFAVLFVAGCSGGSGGSGDTGGSGSFIDQNSELATTVINNYVDDVVVATYADLSEKATVLREAVESIEGGAQADVQDAADAWIEARIPWEQSEAWLFGPVAFRGYDPALDLWPVDRNELQEVLDSDDEITEEYIADELGNLLKGFHTVEYLLFREGRARDLSDINTREILYLIGTARDIESKSAELLESWTEGDTDQVPYSEQMKSAGNPGSPFRSQLSAIEQMIIGMSTILDEVGAGKIADPFDEQDVEKVESQFSFNSRADFAHDIVGVLNVYLGCRIGGLDDRMCSGTGGLKDLIAQSDSALADRVENEINAAIDAILAINQPFRDAIIRSNPDFDGPNIIAAQGAIREVFDTLNGEVLDLLRQ